MSGCKGLLFFFEPDHAKQIRILSWFLADWPTKYFLYSQSMCCHNYVFHIIGIPKNCSSLKKGHFFKLVVKIYFACWNCQVTPAEAYLEKFNFAMAQFFQAVSGIVAIFSYMVRSIHTAKMNNLLLLGEKLCLHK